ncbi:hypothetical protein [Shewanella sp. SR44-3]|uniref:hypothetical protein n=1 Tax=unclassified Shewanella TaxID=196818 RepID=UPI0015FA7820|nr:hypothetical protein [Shewanella sp. SR44-3]MBB1270615.1 hypothetical protein [Shewanella sp. SR44-3]
MNYQYFILAKALHILAIVFWIGGVAFVTTVLLPALRRDQDESQRLAQFERLEGQFSFQAKFATLLAGATGFYMLHMTNAWPRLFEPSQWWLHLMIFIWAIFTLVLFVLEPLFLHRWFHAQAVKNSQRTFKLLQGMHIILLSLSLTAVFAGMIGAHGYQF